MNLFNVVLWVGGAAGASYVGRDQDRATAGETARVVHDTLIREGYEVFVVKIVPAN